MAISGLIRRSNFVPRPLFDIGQAWYGMPCHTNRMPWHGMPWLACPGMLWRAMAWHAIPCIPLPCHSMPCHDQGHGFCQMADVV